MRINKYIISILALLTILSSCIKNDIPYPRDAIGFLSINVEGESYPAEIDSKNQIVTLHFNENVNIGDVLITDYTLSDGAYIVSPDLKEKINLREDVKVRLHKYYDSEWTIKADQPIDRYFTVKNQIGASVIDVVAKRVIVYVSKNTNLSKVEIESQKLGPDEVSRMVPTLTGQVANCEQPLSIQVSYYDIKEKWTVYVQNAENTVSTESVDAWSKVIWAYGSGQAGRINGFEYREAGSGDWIKLDDRFVSHNGGAFSAYINDLKESTTYEVRAYSGEEYGEILSATTDQLSTLPNAMLNKWHKNGNVWNPWADGESSFWDTGNKGASTLGDSNTVPSTDTWDGNSGQSAMLQTKFVGIGVVGKLAAGNLFTGQYMKTDGTNGILNFGRPFTGRPTRLHGFMKYHSELINYANSDHAYLKGRPDTAQIYMVLTDWSQPYEIRTNPKNQQLFSVDDPNIIAYGSVSYGSNVDKFTEFVIDLKYRSTSRKPKYILIVCSASKYGDFFTGGAGSVLYVNNLWFDWSY